MLIMVLQINCFFFLSLKIAAKFSIHFSIEISPETNFGAVGTAVRLGFRFEFLNFLKLKINSKCDMSILIVDVGSIFKVLFNN